MAVIFNQVIATSLLKIIGFFGAWLAIWLPIAIPLARFVDWHPFDPFTLKQKLFFLNSLYFLAPLVIWLGLKIEGFSLADCGIIFRPVFALSLCLGLLIGLLGLMAVFSWEYLLGYVLWHRENLIQLRDISLPIFVLAIWVSLIEELIFRGFLINELERTVGIAIAAIISSLIFAFLHLIWEQKETIPQLPGLWLMGLVLVAARLVARGNLGLAWGLHTAWIWGLSCLDGAKLLTYTDTASPWFIGWNRQPLAGIAGIACLLITAICLLIVST
jgi:hypothetical protein